MLIRRQWRPSGNLLMDIFYKNVSLWHIKHKTYLSELIISVALTWTIFDFDGSIQTSGFSLLKKDQFIYHISTLWKKISPYPPSTPQPPLTPTASVSKRSEVWTVVWRSLIRWNVIKTGNAWKKEGQTKNGNPSAKTLFIRTF